MNHSVAQRAAGVRLLVLDIDGVLTDGRVIYDSDGRETKVFDVKDGHGLKLLMRAGVQVAWLSGRVSEVNRKRAAELGVSELAEKALVKLPVFEQMLEKLGMAADQAAYMGDDLIDLPPMRAAHLALAPCDAVAEVRAAAHWISSHPGGRGAVRQACELILRASGAWQEVTARYF